MTIIAMIDLVQIILERNHSLCPELCSHHIQAFYPESKTRKYLLENESQ